MCGGPIVYEEPTKSAKILLEDYERVFFGTVISYEDKPRGRMDSTYWVTVSVDKNIKGVADKEIINFYLSYAGCGGFYPPKYVGMQMLFWNNETYSDLFSKKYDHAVRNFPMVYDHQEQILRSGGCSAITTFTGYELSTWPTSAVTNLLGLFVELQKLAEPPELSK